MSVSHPLQWRRSRSEKVYRQRVVGSPFGLLNTDPINFVDAWGLLAADPGDGTAGEPDPFRNPGFGSEVLLTAFGPGESQNFGSVYTGQRAQSPVRFPNVGSPVTVDGPRLFTQGELEAAFGSTFSGAACAVAATANCVSMQYTETTGRRMSLPQAVEGIEAAVEEGAVAGPDQANAAYMNNWENAANAMWGTTGLEGMFIYNEQGEMRILAEDSDQRDGADHFVNALDEGTYFDTYSGDVGEIGDTLLQQGRRTRGFDFQ